MKNSIYRKKTIENLEKRIALLGIDSNQDAISFMNIRVLSTLLLFFIVLYISKVGYLLAPAICFVYYAFLPKYFIDYKAKKRGLQLEKEALYFFEILTLSLESGRNLYNALEITSTNIDSDLSHEFRYVLQEVKYGKNLDESLENMKQRVPSDFINNILLNIRESNIFGNNIVETLHNQIDFIRDKRTMEIKEKINKMPLKVSVVSVIFFIPLIMLLILGPVLINYLLGL